LDAILGQIGDFGRMKNDILDSMFVQSLQIIFSRLLETAVTLGSVAPREEKVQFRKYKRDLHMPNVIV